MAFVIGKIRDVIGERAAPRYWVITDMSRQSAPDVPRLLRVAGGLSGEGRISAARSCSLSGRLYCACSGDTGRLCGTRGMRACLLRLLRRLGIGRCGAGQSGEYRPRDDGRPAAFLKPLVYCHFIFSRLFLGNHDITLHIETSI